MKKILITTASLLLSSIAFSQINTQSDINSVIDNQNPFLDASGYSGAANNIAKGLYFPRTDLTKWEFTIGKLGKFKFFKSAFDGMIVYNTVKGEVGEHVEGGYNAETQGKRVKVEPGFYYFSNPDANLRTKNVSSGQWVRIGSGEANIVKEADYKEGVAVETGAKFYINATDKKPVYRKMVSLDFNGTYVELPKNTFDANDVFINAYLINQETTEVIGSVRIKRNVDVNGEQRDFVYSSNGSLFTTLSGPHKLIAEYYVK